MNLNEVAPPTKKHERMVKHIKKTYKKDGKLTDDEKSIAYATAWKNYNKKESFEIDKAAHKAAQKKTKMRNLAKGNTNPNEKAAAEKKAGGPKLYGEAKKLQTNNIPKREMKNINYRYKNLHKKDMTGTVGEEVSRRHKPSAVAKKKKLEKLLIDKEVKDIQKESSFQQFMADVKAAKDRQKKQIEDRKKKDAAYVDRKKHGVKFYDKKGSGRIVKGRKVYS